MYDPNRDNRYSEDWVNFLIWFDRDGKLTEKDKKSLLSRWFGNNRYSFISTARARQLGFTPRTK